MVRGMSSLTQSFEAYTTPEVLCEDNQYSCSVCEAKSDADKGMHLKSVPYLLTLQLKRFDFDFFTMQRVKVGW